MGCQVNQTLNNGALNAHPDSQLGLSAVIDVFGEPDLFETIDNERVLELSRLGDRSGFSSTKAIAKSTGIEVRRLLRADQSARDLGVRLINRLQEQLRSNIDDFDHILLCHSFVNDTQCQTLARQLEADFDLPDGRIQAFNHGCAGYLKLLQEGADLLEGGPAGQRALLLSVETPEFWHDAADRLFCGIVSAGATASVLETGHGLPVHFIQADDFRIPESRRPNPDPLFSKDTQAVHDFRGTLCERTVMRMNPEPVFLNGIELMLDNLRAALLSMDYQPGQRVIVAPHQPSAKLLKALTAAARTEFPELEFLNNLASYGNTISSTVPTLVSRLDEVLTTNQLAPIQPGDQLILLAAGICMKEICNHMSAGHACLTWQPQLFNVPRSPVVPVPVHIQ